MRARPSLAQPRNRNRQTLRSCKRVRAVAQALDSRTHDRLVESLSPTGQGLGESQSQRSRFPQARVNPPYVTKTLQSLIKPPDGLLGFECALLSSDSLILGQKTHGSVCLWFSSATLAVSWTVFVGVGFPRHSAHSAGAARSTEVVAINVFVSH
jgi:hypothetical protein